MLGGYFQPYFIMNQPMTTKEKCVYYALVFIDGLKSVWRFLFTKSDTSPYSGRYLSKREQLQLLSENNTGIVVNGRLRLGIESHRHCLVLGSTGSGKSTNIFIPSILALDDPMVVLDCSGSLFDQTSGHLESVGFEVLKLDFSDVHSSLAYNPLRRANTDSKRKRLASTLVETSLGESKDPFWNNSARQIIYILIRCLTECADKKYHTLANIRYLLNNLQPNPKSPTFKWVMEHADDVLYGEFKAVLLGNEKVINSVLATCRTALELLSDPDIATVTSSDSLGDLGDIRRGKVALFICISETDISYLNFIVSVILGDILDMCMVMPTKQDKDLYLLLDEFAHFRIKDFSTCLTTLRKRRVSVTLATQSRSMLSHKYGSQDADSIINGGCASRIILPGSTDYAENKALSELFGSQMVTYKNKEMVRPLITPDEIYALKGEALFLHAGHRPAKLKLYPFYKDKQLLKLTEKQAVNYQQKTLPAVTFVPLTAEKQAQETERK